MIGVLLGGACGAVELVLLRLLVDKISAGEVPVWILPLKLLVIPAFLVPCAAVAKDQLHIAGIAAGAVLIIGAVTLFCIRAHNKKERTPSSGGDAK